MTQIFVQSYCPICRKKTTFVSHADEPEKFICTNPECFGYTTSELEEKIPMEQVMNPYTGLFDVRGGKVEKVKEDGKM